MPTHADGHITHQLDPAAVGVGTQSPPLAEAQPLDEGIISEPVSNGWSIEGTLAVEESAGFFRSLAGCGPLAPGEGFAVAFH